MLINEKTWEFVRQHANGDVRKLALQGAKDAEVDLQTALQQIAGRQTARRKLPSWAEVEGVVYPPHLNMEQCSSEQTARYKAQIAGKDESIVDLTGGFGVDFYWISQGFRQRTYVEQNEQLCAIAQENFRTLGHDCCVYCCDTAIYLSEMPHVNLVFLDPARRNEHGGRTYDIEDCTPNILELLPLLVQKTDRILLKLSPMLDWRKAVSDLEKASPDGVFQVTDVHIVSVDNECKELLLLLGKEQTDGLRVVCVNGASSFTFILPPKGRSVARIPSVGMFSSQAGNNLFPGWEHLTSSDLAESPLYLYEPNASIMKAGCFAEVEAQFPVRQVSSNSHLFLSSDEIDDFPGRKFRILAISSMNKQEIKKKFSESLVPMESANIAVRNFPMTAELLRKKLKLKDGGDTYIFATTLVSGEHKLFFCCKIG
ncbi:MAG: SAM-dependent methyltransferase [Prevotella sp.]|nr:SAM-dependent methyltransferase [Prevotella sp.]